MNKDEKIGTKKITWRKNYLTPKIQKLGIDF